MSKGTKAVLIIAAVCIVMSLVLFSAAMFFGGADLRDGIETEIFGFGVHAGTDGVYAGNPGSVVVTSSENLAEITENVDAIEINWTSGSVNFEIGGENIVVYETADGEIAEKECMVCYVENGTLRVKYREDRIGIADIGIVQSKNLTVVIPENLVHSIRNIFVSTTSANVTLGGLETDDLKIYSTSGDVFVKDVSAGAFIFDGTSGNISLENSTVGFFRADTTSGDVSLSSVSAGSAGFDTNSGAVYAENCTFGNVEAESTSGNIYMSLNEVPAAFDADTTSGNVELYLPEDAEFTLEFDHTSGELVLDFAAVMRGDEYTVGSGRNEISIETTSGDAYIRVK